MKNYAIVKILLDHGANVNATTLRGGTALHQLCRTKPRAYGGIFARKMLLRLLLDRGVDVSVRDQYGMTAFLHAFQNDEQDVCDIMFRLQKVSQPLTSEDLDKMASSVCGGDKNTVTLRVEMMLDMDAHNHLGSSSEFVMRLCRQSQNSLAIFLCLEKYPLNLDVREKAELLHHAIKNDHPGLIKHMLALKAPMDQSDSTGCEPLYNAVGHLLGYPERDYLIRVMLAAGARIHVPQSNKMLTPLHLAIQLCRAEFIRIMLNHQPLRRDPDASGKFYLHTAAAIRSDSNPYVLRLVSILVRSEASRTELNTRGDMPLGTFLHCCLHQDWTQKPRGFFPPLRGRVYETMIRLWHEDIDIRARNNSGESIMSYLDALKLYQGDDEFLSIFTSLLRECVRVVPVAGSKRPDHVTLVFLPIQSRADKDDLTFV